MSESEELTSRSYPLRARIRDNALLASWVLLYAFLLKIFTLLRRLELRRASAIRQSGDG